LHGHTPGHTGYEFSSNGQKVLFWGDTINAQIVQLRHPEVTVVFDIDHAAAAATRNQLLARKRWLNALKTIRDLKPAVVIPGHSKVGAPIDATSAVTFTGEYLSVFEQELKRAKDPDGLVKAMKEEFPSADLLLALERGAKANVKQQHYSGGAE
jgi:glyoxylase-like metal-dependent hydrolase (beta-lactamase superfamily II)